MHERRREVELFLHFQVDEDSASHVVGYLLICVYCLKSNGYQCFLNYCFGVVDVELVPDVIFLVWTIFTNIQEIYIVVLDRI